MRLFYGPTGKQTRTLVNNSVWGVRIMRSFKLKGRITSSEHADKNKSTAVKEVLTTPSTPRVSVKEVRGIYSSTRNLDSNFRC